MTHNAKELILAVKESELKPGNQVAQAEIVRTAKDFLPVIVTFLVKHFVKIWKSHCIKKKFPIKDSSVNVTKSAGNCGFGHIY